MRLYEYYKMWNLVYGIKDLEFSISESIDLTTKVKKKNGEYYFWVDQDLYIVKIINKGKSHYELSLVYKDLYDEETSSLTQKNKPFRVMDGVATSMKLFIEEMNPNIIEFNVFGPNKKTDMFIRILNLVIKKYSNIFGVYNIKKEKTQLNLGYDLPDDIDMKKFEGIKVLMYK